MKAGYAMIRILRYIKEMWHYRLGSDGIHAAE